MVKYYRYMFLILPLIPGCTEPYAPELKDDNAGKTLIVEGYIDADGNSEYKLGYISPIYKTVDSSFTWVNDARISIEEENGDTYNNFSLTGNSRYIFNHPPLRLNSRYRLRILTGGKEYLSDFVPLMVSPEIEKVTWKQDINEGINFFVDTRADNQTYFRWEYEETWEFKAPMMSLFLFNGSRVRERSPQEYFPLSCFKYENSNDLYLYTTESQEENLVRDFHLHTIPNFSEKLDLHYSILVKQYAVSKEAFAYWSLVKKNSEDIGDIFGTMPTEVPGNIACISHPQEKVVGMIEAGKVAKKRIFLDYTDYLIPWTQLYTDYAPCISSMQIVPVSEANTFFSKNPEFIPVDEFFFDSGGTGPGGAGSPTHYTYSIPFCADCSLRGSRETPSFWKNQKVAYK